MVTIKDIARESGYSVSTVSRVLNNRNDVSPDARKKIEEVVAKFNFVPNNNAKHLKQNNSKMCIRDSLYIPRDVQTRTRGDEHGFLYGELWKMRLAQAGTLQVRRSARTARPLYRERIGDRKALPHEALISMLSLIHI